MPDIHRAGISAVKDVWHLSEVNWWEELTPEEAVALKSSSVCHEFPATEMVFAPDPNPNSVYLLEAGLVRIYRLSEAGSETTFGYVSPGEVFGELAVLDDFPRESFAQAVEDSVVWRIPRHVFQDLANGRPGFVLAVTHQIGERLKRIENRVESLVFRDVRSRVAQMLLELAEGFGRSEADGERLVIDIPLTQSELATLVGSSRQSVNASLRGFVEEGLIERDGHHIVLLKREELARSGGALP